MNTLRESLDDYLALRRALGFKLRSEGAALSTFVAFMEQNQADYISTARALEWAKLPALVQPGRWTSRLGYIRGLARYCSSFDLRTEVPPVGLLPFVHRRPTPYFFTDDDIDCLLTGAQKLPAKNAIVSQTFYCLFGLSSVRLN